MLTEQTFLENCYLLSYSERYSQGINSVRISGAMVHTLPENDTLKMSRRLDVLERERERERERESQERKRHININTFLRWLPGWGGSPDRVARGLPTGGQGSKVYVPCAEPKDINKHFVRVPGREDRWPGWPGNCLCAKCLCVSMFQRTARRGFPDSFDLSLFLPRGQNRHLKRQNRHLKGQNRHLWRCKTGT